MRKTISVVVCLTLVLTAVSFSTAYNTNDTIYVDDDNTEGPWDGTQEHPYQYIQDGIDVASDGDTIFVYDGTYHEMIVIDKSITLQGEDKTSTSIDGCGGELLKEDVVYIKANRVNMSGFTIKNSAQGYSYEAGIAMKEANHCVITDNILTENEWGMDVRDSQYNSIIDNVISSSSGGIHLCFSENNLISNCTIEQIEVRGISVYVSAGNTIISNTFTECGLEIYTSPPHKEIHNIIIENTVNGKPLVYLENESNVIIDDAGQVILLNCEDITVRNLDLHHASTGVRVVDSKRVTISSNVISNNVHGISIVESQHVVIEKNIIEDNWGTGVGIYQTFTGKNEILNNTIINNGKGIYVHNCLSGKTIIENNDISNNEEGIYISSESCDISYNNICDNSEYGVVIWVSKGNLIYGNNFIGNNVNAYFEYHREIGSNQWNTMDTGNYWDDWAGSGPKVIWGKQRGLWLPWIAIPWFNLDWQPASEPYEI
jgi:parallel beta-helix repeat protein